jgi:hypothetical protein
VFGYKTITVRGIYIWFVTVNIISTYFSGIFRWIGIVFFIPAKFYLSGLAEKISNITIIEKKNTFEKFCHTGKTRRVKKTPSGLGKKTRRGAKLPTGSDGKV